MNEQTNCPNCGAPLAVSGACTQCEYGRKAKGATGFDADWWRCPHFDRGQRCAKAGVVSPSTLGGQMWCWNHVPGLEQFHPRTDSSPKTHAHPVGTIAAAIAEASAERKALQAPDDLPE